MFAPLALALALGAADAPPPVELPAWIATRLAGDPSVATKAYKLGVEAPMRRFATDTRAATVPEGPLAGQWTFFGAPGADKPTGGWRMAVASAPPYRVDVELYCEGTDCEAMRRALASMRAPKVYEDAALVAEWEAIVATEACTPGQGRNTPAPAYPPEEQRRGIAGDVTIGLFHNGCGEVRNVWIVRSSGSRNLDRATVRKASGWTVAPAEPGRAGRLQTTINFSVGGASTPYGAGNPSPPPAVPSNSP